MFVHGFSGFFMFFFMFFKSNFLTGAGHQFLPSVWEQITQVCPLPLFSSVHRFRYIEIHHHHHYSSPSSQSPSLSALYATGCQYTKHPHRSRINIFWFWTFYIILACCKIINFARHSNHWWWYVIFNVIVIVKTWSVTFEMRRRCAGDMKCQQQNIYIGQRHHRQHHDH